MREISTLLLAGGLAVGSVVAAQAQQRSATWANGAEQRVVEVSGLERLPSSAPALSTLQNAATLLQNGQSNTARIDQQSLAGGVSNQAYIEQIGTANALGITQTGSNNASVVQQGDGNRAYLTQNGQGNASDLTQKGDNNRLTGLVVGNNNGLNIHQDGSNNQVDSEIRQNKQAYTISQYGSGNALKQVESTSQTTPGYSVEMRGTGINLTIEQGKIKP